MNIGVITGTFHPESGGPPTYLYYLLPRLGAEGHTIRLLTFGEPTPDDHGYGYPVTRISRRLSRPARQWAYYRALLKLARQSDVLFVMGYVMPLSLLRLFTRKRITAKIVSDWSWEFADRNKHVTLDVSAYQTARLPRKLALLRAYYRYAVRQTDAIIAPSSHVAALVRGWGVPSEKIHVIYNAIPDNGLREVSRSDLRETLGLPAERPVLVSVARLTPVKGVDVMINALPHIPNAVFVVVGDGPSQPDLEAQAASSGVADRVRFVGRQEHEAVMQYIRAADAFVLSSRTEGLSHVLLETLSVGTPAVATRVGGNPEVLTDEVNGLLIPPEDPAALAAAVQRLIDDPALASRLTEAGLTRSADFSWETTVQQTLAIITGE